MGIITIDATSSGSAGVNVNATINNATPGFSPIPAPIGTGNAGVFVPGGSQYQHYGLQPASGSNSAVIADGDFTYATGTLSGTLDSLSLGNVLRDAGTVVASPSASFGGTALTLDSTAFTISNIGLSGSGLGNALNTTLFGFLGGNEAALNSYLFSNSANSINFIGSAGNDTITGSINADTLNGNGGNDVLNGGNGNDTINGGAGQDTLNGGGGSDIFIFSSAADSAFGAGDTLVGFQANATDKIDLSALSVTYGGTSAGANSVWHTSSGTTSTVFADVDGDSVADLQIAITGRTGALDATDFIL